MAISSAVMDSVCDNGCNTLSVLFTLGLTCLLSVPQLSTQFTAATFHSLEQPPPQKHTHTHIVKQRQTGWQRGVVPMMKHLKQAVEACVHPLCLNPLTAPVPAWTPHQQVSMTWGGGGEEAQFNNAKATSVSQMESLFPRGWGGVGLKHQAPAGPHDCADIAA